MSLNCGWQAQSLLCVLCQVPYRKDLVACSKKKIDLNVLTAFSYTCYKVSQWRTPVILWDVIECLLGLSERGKRWDYE